MIETAALAAAELVLGSIVAVLIGWIGWLSRTSAISARRLAVLEERAQSQEQRIVAVERVHARLDTLSAQASHIDGQLSQLNRGMTLLTEHLLAQRP